MTIAVNTRFLLKDYLEGYGNFTFETFSRIARLHPEHTFIYIFDRPYEASFITSKNIIPVVVSPEARHPILWWIWFNIKIPRVLKKYKADMFVSPDGFCSLFTKVPQVLVVHDLAFVAYSGFIKKSHLRYYRTFTLPFLKKAEVIGTVSEFSKNDIVKKFRIKPEKIDVVYSGVNELFQPVDITEREQVKAKYAGGNEYFLFTGPIHPRKNLLNLLRAFSQFKKWQKSSMKLVITGRLAWQYDEFTKGLASYKYKDDVIQTGFVPVEELVKITAGAYAMVYPSLFEGFGLPPPEAMKCGVPVITSNVSAMPEICGNAALFFDPANPLSIAEKMMLIFKDEELRKTKIEEGRKVVEQYSWDRTAGLLWDCILKAV